MLKETDLRTTLDRSTKQGEIYCGCIQASFIAICGFLMQRIPCYKIGFVWNVLEHAWNANFSALESHYAEHVCMMDLVDDH